MNRRGVGYDAGILFSGLGWRLSTRPVFDPGIVRRELEIIRTGAFVHTFAEPIMTYSKDPRYDLDRSGMALVKTYASGHGTTYPDMIWEPKPAFRAVTGYYARDSASATAGE